MKKIIHINQHTIKKNSKTGSRDPVITVKTYKSNKYYNALNIIQDGKIVAQVVYSPDKPLKGKVPRGIWNIFAYLRGAQNEVKASSADELITKMDQITDET